MKQENPAADTPGILGLKPAFAECNVPVFCATNNNYAPYCGVMLASLIEHAKNEHNYDIIVLEDSLSDEYKYKLLSLKKNLENVSIRFYDVSPLIAGKKFRTLAHFTKETYYRLYAPTILQHYEKAVYLDCDIVLEADVAELYHVDIQENWVAAVLDYGVMAKLKSGNYHPVKYFTEQLKLRDPYEEYFVAGVMIFNIKELIRHNVEEQFISEALNQKYLYLDQDILNKICHDHVYYLDSAWNTVNTAGLRKGIMNLIPQKHYDKWLADKVAPKLVHYSSGEKPWKAPHIDMAELWWDVARHTLFYEDIIYKQINQKISAAEKLLDDAASYPRNWRKYWQYRLLAWLTFGKRQRKFKELKRYYEIKLKSIKKWLKSRRKK